MNQAHPVSRFLSPSRGFTLMELIVTIGLCAVIFTAFTATISASMLLRKSTYVIQAGNFLREEIDSLRTIPFTELTTRTNDDFLGLSLTRGAWTVKTAAAKTGARGMALETAKTALANNETGLAIIPGNYHQDMTLTASVKVLSTSPTGWGAGLVFHYRDAENAYRVRYSVGGVVLEEIYHGTVTTLGSNSTAMTSNTWYTLQVVTSGTSITVKKNGTTIITVTDGTLTTGDVGVMALSGALIYVDDVSLLEGGTTTTWNFDTDTLDAMPTDWQRFVYFDLPSGAGTLTISNYNGQSTIKLVTVTVNWTEAGIAKSLVGSTLITE